MKLPTLLRKQHVQFTSWIPEQQNAAYEGGLAHVGPDAVATRMRLAKATPKKAGYFVVFWEKNAVGQNQAYPAEEAPDQLLIGVMDEETMEQGYFLFPKTVLVAQKILRTADQPGKMAMRVYPSWCQNLNPQAQKTQNWQLPYFYV